MYLKRMKKNLLLRMKEIRSKNGKFVSETMGDCLFPFFLFVFSFNER